MTATISRQGRRKLQRLAVEIDRVIDADERFFDRRPDRTYRVRRLSRPETESLDIVTGAPAASLSEGKAAFALVKKLNADVRLRIYINGPADEDGSGLSDDQCVAIWNQYACDQPEILRKEAVLRRLTIPAPTQNREGGT